MDHVITATNIPLIIPALLARPSHLFSTLIKNKLFSLLVHQQHRILELESVHILS